MLSIDSDGCYEIVHDEVSLEKLCVAVEIDEMMRRVKRGLKVKRCGRGGPMSLAGLL